MDEEEVNEKPSLLGSFRTANDFLVSVDLKIAKGYKWAKNCSAWFTKFEDEGIRLGFPLLAALAAVASMFFVSFLSDPNSEFRNEFLMTHADEECERRNNQLEKELEAKGQILDYEDRWSPELDHSLAGETLASTLFGSKGVCQALKKLTETEIGLSDEEEEVVIALLNHFMLAIGVFSPVQIIPKHVYSAPAREPLPPVSKKLLPLSTTVILALRKTVPKQLLPAGRPQISKLASAIASEHNADEQLRKLAEEEAEIERCEAELDERARKLASQSTSNPEVDAKTKLVAERKAALAAKTADIEEQEAALKKVKLDGAGNREAPILTSPAPPPPTGAAKKTTGQKQVAALATKAPKRNNK